MTWLCRIWLLGAAWASGWIVRSGEWDKVEDLKCLRLVIRVSVI
jgi:hypothetical protein